MPYKLSILFWFSFLWSTTRAVDYFSLEDKSDGVLNPVIDLAISGSNSVIVKTQITDFHIYKKQALTSYYDLQSMPNIPLGNILCTDMTKDG